MSDVYLVSKNYECDSPVNDPFERGRSSRSSTLNIPSSRSSNVSLDIEVREEGSVKGGAWGSAATEVHRVGAVQTLAVSFGLDVSGVLRESATVIRCPMVWLHTMYQ